MSFGDHMTAEDEAIEDSSGPPPPPDAHEGDLQMTEGPNNHKQETPHRCFNLRARNLAFPEV